MEIKPWTKKERKEIARLRKAGYDDSYIRGSMKMSRCSDILPSVAQRSRPMATKKKTGKKASKKTTAGKKPAAKPGRKAGGFQVGEKLTAIKGQDDKFYKKFPRYAAYQLLCKKGSMKTSAFVDAVEKLDGVKTRGQALGILTKLLNKGCATASGKTAKA